MLMARAKTKLQLKHMMRLQALLKTV